MEGQFIWISMHAVSLLYGWSRFPKFISTITMLIENRHINCGIPCSVNNEEWEDEFAHPFWNVVVELIKKRDLYFYLTEGAIFFLCCVFTSYLKQRSNTSILRGYTIVIFRRFYWIGGISYEAWKLSAAKSATMRKF